MCSYKVSFLCHYSNSPLFYWKSPDWLILRIFHCSKFIPCLVLSFIFIKHSSNPIIAQLKFSQWSLTADLTKPGFLILPLTIFCKIVVKNCFCFNFPLHPYITLYSPCIVFCTIFGWAQTNFAILEGPGTFVVQIKY